MVCPCIKGGVTERLHLAARPGASLLLVPKALIGNWKREMQQVGIEEALSLRMCIQHRDWQDDSVHSYMKAWLQLQCKEKTADDSVEMELDPESMAHSLIIMTTIESYDTWVRQRLGAFRYWREVEKPSSDDTTDGIAWARVIRDEAHLLPKWQSTFYRILESLANNAWVPPNFVAITATPILSRWILDAIPIIRGIVLVSPELSKDDAYRQHGTSKQLDEWEAKFDTVLSGDSDEKATDEAEVHAGELLTAFTIQRRHDTVQNGKPLAALPLLEAYNVLCQAKDGLGEDQIHQVEKHLKKSMTELWKERQTFECSIEDLLTFASRGRLLATIPGLIKYESMSDVTFKNIVHQDWHNSPEQSDVYKDIGRLVKGSVKLQVLRHIIKSLGHDVYGQPEKLIVMTDFPVVCLAVLAVRGNLSSFVLSTLIMSRSVERWMSNADGFMHR